MKTRLIHSFLLFFLVLGVSASITFGQHAASVTWNLFGADSLSPTTTVGNILGQTVTQCDTLAIKDMTGGAPNSPIPGVTKAMRWYPFINGTAVNWGGTDTLENPRRWIQFTAAPKTGNAFVVDSISLYLGASGTSDHIRANLYYSTDPTFATKTMLNPADTGVVPYRDSLSHYGYDVKILVKEGESLYFRIYPFYDGSASTSKYINTQYVQLFGVTAPKSTLANARTMRGSGGDTLVAVTGVVISPNYQTSNRSYYIWDGTDGIDLYAYGLKIFPALTLGDSVTVVGSTTMYYGLLEINPYIDHDTTSVAVVKTGAVVPQPEIITVHEFVTNAEKYESHLIGFMGLTKSSGVWPTSNSNKSIYMKDGSGNDSIQVFVDLDTKLYQMTEPTWPQDMIGVASQYASSGVGGYQVLPRYTTDFLAPGTLPVELSTFTAVVNMKSVTLNWQTATETNNSGFDVERSSDGVNFAKIAFVKGKGNSTENTSYSFIDQSLRPGSYSYRLKQIDYSGKFEYSNAVEAQIISAPTTFTLSQNYPNPFNPSTVINFSVDKQGLTSLKVYNVLGQEVSILFNSIAAQGQVYTVNFDASKLSSGIYFYQLQQGNLVQIHKMMLMK